jgi:hypothetical protein
LALVVPLVGATDANAAGRGPPRDWLGVTVDGPLDPSDGDEWERMSRAGVETVRTAFVWAQVQPLPPAVWGARFDFRATDAVAIAAATRGIAVLPVVQLPPYWAAVEPGEFGSPPADLRAVRRIFAALVARYGPRGSLWRDQPGLPRRPIRAWQVFNEPNFEGFWSVQPFARDYVATLRAAERGIHDGDPGATVVLGGLTKSSWEALQAVYAAGGRGSFDAVAIHPYARSPARILRVVRYARRVMRINGDGQLPIWVTEFSWPATAEMLNPSGSERVFGQPITDYEQARLLNRTLRLFLGARERLGIARVLWYTWLSGDAPASQNAFAYAGLRRVRDDVRRNTPALSVFRRWARRLHRCPRSPPSHRCR